MQFPCVHGHCQWPKGYLKSIHLMQLSYTFYSKHALKVSISIPVDSISLRSQFNGLLEALVCSSQVLLHCSAIQFPLVRGSCIQ